MSRFPRPLPLTRLLPMALACLALLAMAAPSMAADFTWTGGGGDSNWSTVGNWQGGAAPDGGDRVIFDSNSVARLSNTNDIAGLTGMQIMVIDPPGDVTVSGLAIDLVDGFGPPIGVDLSGASRDLTLNMGLDMGGACGYDVLAGRTLTLGGTIGNTLNAEGAGTIRLTGTCTNSVHIKSGTFQLLPGAVFSAGGFTMDGTLDLNGVDAAMGMINPTGDVDTGGAVFTWSPTVDSSMSGDISGTGDLITGGSKKRTLTAGASYTGSTEVNQGELVLQGALASDQVDVTCTGGNCATLTSATNQALPANTVLNVDSGAVFDLDGNDQTVAQLTGGGQVDLGAGDFIFGDATNTTFSGLIGGNLNTGDVTKTGTGTVRLTGGERARFTTGVLNINQGALQVDNFWVSTAINVANGATLQGDGILVLGQVNVAAGGTLSPGSGGPGQLILEGGVSLPVGADFDVDINGTNPGVTHDVLVSGGGTVTLGGDLNITLGYVPQGGDTYTIIDNQALAAINGTFNGLAERALFSIGAHRFRITYVGGDGNDVVIKRLNDGGGGGGGDDGDTEPEPTPDAPSAPTANSSPGANPSGGGLSAGYAGIGWSAVSGADHYRVYRAACPTCTRELVGTTHGTSYQDTTAEPGRIYFYWVRAVNDGGWSGWANYLASWRYDPEGGFQGDFNGDGVSDTLVWKDGGLYVASYLDGLIQEATLSRGAAPEGFIIQGVADFDGNGYTDILWRNPDTGAIQIWLLSQGDVEFASSGAEAVTAAEMTGAAQHPVPADLNGDGKGDLAWRDLSSGGVTLWIMDGDTPVVMGPPALGEGAELRLRGGADLVSGAVTVADQAASADAPWPTAATNWFLLSGADLDGSGGDDLLWWCMDDNRVVAWLMDGVTISRGWQLDPGSHAGWMLAGAADLDGDGVDDLVWRRVEDGGLTAWLMSAEGAVRESRSLGDAPGAAWVYKDGGDFLDLGKDQVRLHQPATGQALLIGLDGRWEFQPTGGE